MKNKWFACGLVAVFTVGLGYAMAQDVDGGARKGRKGDRAAKQGAGERAGRAKGDRPARGGASFDYTGVAAELGLNKEQTEKLAGLIINQQLQMRMSRLALAEDQKARIKALCLETGKEVLLMDARGQAQAMRTLEEKVRTDVLTEEQRTTMGAGRAAGKAGDAPRRERPGKAGRAGAAVAE